MVIIKCDNRGLWCNINRAERERENGNIIVCRENYFPSLKEFRIPVVVRFVEFICCRMGECEEVIVVFVAEAGAASRGQQEDNRIQIGADH